MTKPVAITLPFMSAKELCETTESAEWLLWPFLVRGGVTDLYGPAKKAGKSTLLRSGFVRSILTGEPFLGQEPRCGPSPVVYFTEEPAGIFKLGLEEAGLDREEDLHILTWASVSQRKWLQVVRQATAFALKVGAAVMVVDTLPQFVLSEVKDENNASEASKALGPLQEAASKGMSIVTVRHTNASGTRARGSTFYTGAVDIVLQLSRAPKVKTQRVITFENRISGAPESVLVDFDGRDYSLVKFIGEDAPPEAQADTREGTRAYALLQERGPMQAAELATELSISRATAQRMLDKDIASGLVSSTGKGTKGSPLLYSSVGTTNKESHP